MKKLLAICVIWLVSSGAYAGIGFYVTIKNMTKYEATISNGGNDEWKCRDFCFPSTIRPYESKRYYTEAKTWWYTPGIQGINISYGNETHHAEFWLNNHSHSVNQNVKEVILTYWLCESRGCRKHTRSAHVGTSSQKIETQLDFLEEGKVGTAYVTLILNE